MIGSSENRVSYNGNDVTTEFPFAFKILEATDLKLLLVEADGTETLLTKDYYVDVNKSVVLYPGYSPGQEPPTSEQPPKLTSGQRLVLYREVPYTQESKLDEHWPFTVIEAMGDKLTILCQQLKDANERAFKLSTALQDIENINLNLPYGKGKAFAWNADGTALELTENPADVLPMVEAEINELRLYIVQKTQEINELVTSLNSLTREELTKLRDECAKYAYNAEQSALVNTRWPVSAVRTRPAWKNSFDIEGQDLLVTVPDVVKINVTE